jgi:hypothetical protein
LASLADIWVLIAIYQRSSPVNYSFSSFRTEGEIVSPRILSSELAGPETRRRFPNQEFMIAWPAWHANPYFTVREMVALEDKESETPFTVTGYVPDLALWLTWNVN